MLQGAHSECSSRRAVRYDCPLAPLVATPLSLSAAAQVVSYGISINLVEVTWKSKIKQQFPNPNDYSAFMGDFSSSTGARAGFRGFQDFASDNKKCTGNTTCSCCKREQIGG